MQPETAVEKLNGLADKRTLLLRLATLSAGTRDACVIPQLPLDGQLIELTRLHVQLVLDRPVSVAAWMSWLSLDSIEVYRAQQRRAHPTLIDLCREVRRVEVDLDLLAIRRGDDSCGTSAYAAWTNRLPTIATSAGHVRGHGRAGRPLEKSVNCVGEKSHRVEDLRLKAGWPLMIWCARLQLTVPTYQVKLGFSDFTADELAAAALIPPREAPTPEVNLGKAEYDLEAGAAVQAPIPPVTQAEIDEMIEAEWANYTSRMASKFEIVADRDRRIADAKADAAVDPLAYIPSPEQDIEGACEPEPTDDSVPLDPSARGKA